MSNVAELIDISQRQGEALRVALRALKEINQTAEVIDDSMPVSCLKHAVATSTHKALDKIEELIKEQAS